MNLNSHKNVLQPQDVATDLLLQNRHAITYCQTGSNNNGDSDELSTSGANMGGREDPAEPVYPTSSKYRQWQRTGRPRNKNGKRPISKDTKPIERMSTETRATVSTFCKGTGKTVSTAMNEQNPTNAKIRHRDPTKISRRTQIQNPSREARNTATLSRNQVATGQ